MSPHWATILLLLLLVEVMLVSTGHGWRPFVGGREGGLLDVPDAHKNALTVMSRHASLMPGVCMCVAAARAVQAHIKCVGDTKPQDELGLCASKIAVVRHQLAAGAGSVDGTL